MRNLTTTIDKNAGFGNTVKHSKTFDTTVNGRNLNIGVERSVISVTAENFNSVIYYTLVYNNEHLGHHNMDRKAFDFYLEMINNGDFDIN